MFKKICIYEKKVLPLYLFSNLWYVKYVFMKKGADNLVTKFVYKSLPFKGGYWRLDSNGDYYSLGSEFPYIDNIAYAASHTFKLELRGSKCDITSWIDKHSNVIVRIINKTFVQSKIDFEDVSSKI